MKRLALLLLGLFFLGTFLSAWYVGQTLSSFGVSPFKLFISPLGTVKKTGDTVSFLLLGIPGGSHEGPNLSDSLLVLSYNLDKNTVAVISLPRDIWSESLEDKINTAYAYGEAKRKGGGLVLAKTEVSTIVGFPIQYTAVLDFQNFKGLVDALHGIDIVVPQSFTDTKYPVFGRENDDCGGDPSLACRYQTITFSEGPAHLDGKQALEYVRSRQAVGSEGNDFARGRRQEQVLVALAGSAARQVKSLDKKRLENLYSLFNRSLIRDISNQEAAGLALHLLFTGKPKIVTVSLPQEFFVVPDYSSYEGKYVLVPENGSYERIHAYLKGCLLKSCGQN